MFSYWFSYRVFLESKEDGRMPYWRGDSEGALEIVVLACEIRSYFMNEPYE